MLARRTWDALPASGSGPGFDCPSFRPYPSSSQYSGRSSAWLERCVRDAKAGGSNPLAPTIFPCTRHDPAGSSRVRRIQQGPAGTSRDQQGPAGPSSACGGERRSRCTTSVRLSPRGPLGRQATRPAAVSERAGLPRLQTWLLQVEDELGLQSGSRTGRMETGIRPWPSLRVRDACAAPPSWIAAGQERLSVVVFSCRNGKGDPAES